MAYDRFDEMAGTDGGSDSLLVSITDQLATARGVDPLDLPPLNEYVDVEALTTLVDSTSDGRGHSRVTFRVEQYEVRVAGDGTAEVRPVEGICERAPVVGED
ncbi:HalOD1 output domain-containing protein (plasmid) [Haloarcula salina]|uniref:HalOD1 output domain-containing protein n=1 Tax=Haloarcula salina TaxID=1429914 RepID=UPI003C6F0A91